MRYNCTFRPGFHTILDDPADAPPQEKFVVEADDDNDARKQLIEWVGRPGIGTLTPKHGAALGLIIHQAATPN